MMLVPLAFVFDVLDGRIARWRQQQSSLGRELDSLADVISFGVAPALLYSSLPYPVEYAPYTVRHVMATLGLLGFTALGFFVMLKHLDPEPIISLDTDWFYRRSGPLLTASVHNACAAASPARLSTVP